MNTLLKLADKFTELLSYLGMIGVLAMMVHICADIVGRTLFGVSIPATLEMVTRYYMLMLVLLPLAWVEKNRGMIAVEVFAGMFGKLGDRILDAFVSLACAGVYCVLSVSTWQKAMEQFNIGSYIIALDTQIYVWPGYFTLPFGFGMAAFVCMLRLLLMFSNASSSDVT